MSVFHPRQLTCPSCSRTSERSVALSVNGGRTRKYRDAIIAGSFQRFSCGHCDQPIIADGPFIYVDFDAGHWFGCFPRAWETSWRDLEREPAETWRRAVLHSSPDQWREDAGRYSIRAVFGLHALREKLLCADAAIDDVELELVKLELMRRPDGPLSMDASARPILTAIADDRLIFLAAGADPDGERTGMRFAAPRSVIEEMRGPAWSEARRELGGGPYVDVGRLVIPGTAPSPWPGGGLATPAR
jgi:hypothetical protein